MLEPLVLLLKLQICYCVCKAGTVECNGLSALRFQIPLLFSSSEHLSSPLLCESHRIARVPGWLPLPNLLPWVSPFISPSL